MSLNGICVAEKENNEQGGVEDFLYILTKKSMTASPVSLCRMTIHCDGVHTRLSGNRFYLFLVVNDNFYRAVNPEKFGLSLFPEKKYP